MRITKLMQATGCFFGSGLAFNAAGSAMAKEALGVVAVMAALGLVNAVCAGVLAAVAVFGRGR